MNCSLFLLLSSDSDGFLRGSLDEAASYWGCRVLIDWHCLARMYLFLVCAGYVCVRWSRLWGILARGVGRGRRAEVKSHRLWFQTWFVFMLSLEAACRGENQSDKGQTYGKGRIGTGRAKDYEGRARVKGDAPGCLFIEPWLVRGSWVELFLFILDWTATGKVKPWCALSHHVSSVKQNTQETEKDGWC